MREVAIQFWDDLVLSETGRKDVRATVTVTVGLDGKWLELDLSAESNELLRQDLARWLRAGREPDEVPAEKKKAKPAWNTRSWEHGREYGKAIRQFAEDNDLPWHTKGGDDKKKIYYNKELRDKYAASIGRLEDK